MANDLAVYEYFDVIEQIKAIADEIGLPMATLAVAWVLSNPIMEDVEVTVMEAEGPVLSGVEGERAS